MERKDPRQALLDWFQQYGLLGITAYPDTEDREHWKGIVFPRHYHDDRGGTWDRIEVIWELAYQANESLILYEAVHSYRQIFTDGRSLPDNDPHPWFYGYSVGKWEGDTLVVQTSGFRDDGWLDIIGSPMSDQAKVTERFRRPDFGHIELEETFRSRSTTRRPTRNRGRSGTFSRSCSTRS